MNYKWFLSALFLILYSIFLIPVAFAADLSIDCNSGCSKTGLDPLFSQTSDSFWYPGRVLTKQIYLKNSSSFTKEMAMQTNKTSSTGSLEEKMSVILTKTGGIPIIWTGTLKSFIDQDKISFGNFTPGASSLYDLSVIFDSLAGNEYQNKEVVFDMKLGFWTEESGGSSSGGGGAGGTGGSGGPSPCTDTKAGTPANLTVTLGPGPDQATLSWNKVSPYTSFLIAYSDNALGPKWGNPNVGDTNTFTISSLGNGTYYFWVRGQNGCMPGDFIGPVSMTLGTGGETVTELPGFSEDTLGVSTPSAETAGLLGEQNGETKGVSAGICKSCIWWQVLLIELVGLLLAGRAGIKNRKLFLVLAPILTYLLFLWLNRNCQSTLIFCQLFWLLDILTFIFYLLLPQLTKPFSADKN